MALQEPFLQLVLKYNKKYMKLFKVILTVAIIGLTTLCINAQELDAPDVKPVTGAYQREHIHERITPISYPLVRESDVTWSRYIWRSINLKEKVNLPLYYPIEPVNNWKSLATILIEAVSTYENEANVFGVHSLTAYADEYFQDRYSSIGEIADKMKYEVTRTDATGATQQIPFEVSSADIQEYHLMEEWFFDKRRSQLDVRIISMAPIFYKKRYDASGETSYDDTPSALFWFYFPEARYYLCKNYVFNIKNDAERRTFDDWFMKRRFGSYIIKISNVYDRKINEYSLGLDALLESEKAKREISEFEFDLWEY